MSRTLLVLSLASASLVAAIASNFIWHAPASAQGVFDFAREATPWAASMNELHVCKAEKVSYAALSNSAVSCTPTGVGFITDAADAQMMYFCSSNGRVYGKSDIGLRTYRTSCTFAKREGLPWYLYANYLECRALTGTASQDDIRIRAQSTPYVAELTYCPPSLNPDISRGSGQDTVRKECFQRILSQVRQESGDPTLRPCPPNTDWKNFNPLIVQKLGLTPAR